MGGRRARRPLPAVGLSCVVGLVAAIVAFIASPGEWLLWRCLLLAAAVGLLVAVVALAIFRLCARPARAAASAPEAESQPLAAEPEPETPPPNVEAPAPEPGIPESGTPEPEAPEPETEAPEPEPPPPDGAPDAAAEPPAEESPDESFEACWQDLSDNGRTVLMAAACFAPSDIPVDDVLAVLQRPEVGRDAETAQEAIEECVALSLLKRSSDDADRLDLDPPLRDYARRKRDELPEGRAVEEAFVRTFVEFALGIDATNWRDAEPRIPHLAEAARLAPQVIDDEDVAWPHIGLGRYYECSGDYDRAREWYALAAEAAEQKLGAEHPRYADCLNNLSGVLRKQGDQSGALEHAVHALNIDEAAYGPDHPNVAVRLNNVAGLMRRMGDPAGARERYERALQIDEAAYGADHPNVATRLNNLAGVLGDAGDLDGARELYARALAILEQSLPADDPKVRVVRKNLEALDRAGDDA